jgi:hypothetical protein
MKTHKLNKVPKQRGAFEYDQKVDLGRTAMKVGKAASAVETFTIAIEPQVQLTEGHGRGCVAARAYCILKPFGGEPECNTGTLTTRTGNT